jgi:ABC-type sugar transport system, periplasmic component
MAGEPEPGRLPGRERGVLRNWPYAVSQLAKPPSKVIGKVGLAPLPGPQGTGASTLGGHNIAISAYSKHKATGLDFIKYIESDATQRLQIEKASLAPIIDSLYTDPTLVKNFPYLPVLLKSIQTAVPRPVTPFYPAVSPKRSRSTPMRRFRARRMCPPRCLTCRRHCRLLLVAE